MRWPSLASDQSFQLWDEISSSHDAVPFYVFHMPTIEVTSQFQKEKFSEALVKRGSKNRPLDRETSSQCCALLSKRSDDSGLDSRQLIAAVPLAWVGCSYVVTCFWSTFLTMFKHFVVQFWIDSLFCESFLPSTVYACLCNFWIVSKAYCVQWIWLHICVYMRPRRTLSLATSWTQISWWGGELQ